MVQPAMIAPGIGLLLTLVFGWWLSRLGRPYHGLLFNLHKLLALAVFVLTLLPLIGMLRGTEPGAFVMALLAFAGLGVLMLFVSGALMSAGKLDHALLHMLHRVALVALVVALPAAILLLGRSL